MTKGNANRISRGVDDAAFQAVHLGGEQGARGRAGPGAEDGAGGLASAEYHVAGAREGVASEPQQWRGEARYKEVSGMLAGLQNTEKNEHAHKI